MTIATNPQTGEIIHLAEDGQWKPAQTSVNPETKELMAFDGKAWAPVPAKSKGLLNYIDDAVRSIASGVTFGYADELAAKGNELFGSGTYEKNIAQERARDAQIPAAIGIPGQIAGAVGSTLVAAPIAAGARVVQAASRLPQALRFAGLGAAEGGLAGSGEATEGNRLPGAAQGAAIGAPVGAAAPMVIRGVSKLASGIKNAVSPQANVGADLARAIARDNDTPAELTKRAMGLNADRPGVAILADAGGENVRGLVERVAQTPGAGRTQVVPALTGRQQSQAARIAVDLRTLTGTHQTAVQAVEETMAQRATSARPLYEKALQVDAATVPEIQAAWNEATGQGWGKFVLNSPDFKRTLQTEYGVRNLPQAGTKMTREEFQAFQSTQGRESAPLMVQIDAWKKQVDGIVGEAIRSGNNNKARVLGDMRDRLIQVVDEHNPAYSTARKAWAGPSRYLDAVEEGRNILNTRVSAEELSRGIDRMADVDREAFRIGAISSVIGKMGADAAKLGDMTKYLRSPEMRAKISALMPTPEARQSWAKRLDFEVSSSELTGRALGNSATARRLAERQDVENLVGDLVMDAMVGTPQSLIRKVVSAGPKWLRDTMRSRADALLADTLTNPNAMQNLPSALRRAAAGQKPSGLTNAAATAGGVEMVSP